MLTNQYSLILCHVGEDDEEGGGGGGIITEPLVFNMAELECDYDPTLTFASKHRPPRTAVDCSLPYRYCYYVNPVDYTVRRLSY